MNSEEGSEFVLRARGLPWSATAEDVEKFFSGCQIEGGPDGIHFTFSKDGRPSGECFVQFASHEDVQKALSKNNEHMGKRYVEVFESKKSEMDWVCKRMGNTTKESGDESVVRLRGLPYGCSKEEVANFFKGLEIAPNGITIAHDEEGKNTGDGYVEFASPEIASQAMNKHKEKIGHRYIEIFPSNIQEARTALQPKPKPLMSTRPGPYDRRGFNGMGSGRFGGQQSGFERRYRGGGGGGGNNGGGRGGFSSDFGGNMRGRSGRNNFGGNFGGNSGGFGGRDSGGGGGGGGLSKSSTGFCIHMRGIPYSASESDIKQWFLPLNAVAIRMEFEIRGSGQRRSSGEADVDFASQADAKAAMSKDRQMMGHRYIELFLRSESDNNDDDWGSGGGGSGDRSFFSGGGGSGGMNYSGGGFGGNQFGNGGGYGSGGGTYGSGGGSGNFGSSGGGNFGGGNTSGNSGYGGGYGGSSGGGAQGSGATQAGSYGNQAGNSFFGVQMSNQSAGPTSLMGNTTASTGFQQQTGYGQTNPTQDVNSYSSTSAGAFNSSASSFYGGDSKSAMVSYPTSY